MQVRPSVGREWAAETGMRDLIDQMDRDPESVLRDPERNIQIACWYLQKIYGQFRDMPDVEARMVAGYNAGPSRAIEWNRVADGAPQLDADQFIARIDIPSTRAYVSAIIARYRKLRSAQPATGQVLSLPDLNHPGGALAPRDRTTTQPPVAHFQPVKITPA